MFRIKRHNSNMGSVRTHTRKYKANSVFFPLKLPRFVLPCERRTSQRSFVTEQVWRCNESRELEQGGWGLCPDVAVRDLCTSFLCTLIFLMNTHCAVRYSSLIYIPLGSYNTKLETVISAYLLHCSKMGISTQRLSWASTSIFLSRTCKK